MPDYRCYQLDQVGLIQGPPAIITCDDAKSAIVKARAMFPDELFEIWESQRRVYPPGPEAAQPLRRVPH